jgi:hypothetical protein
MKALIQQLIAAHNVHTGIKKFSVERRHELPPCPSCGKALDEMAGGKPLGIIGTDRV